jgi:hypothetical protein
MAQYSSTPLASEVGSYPAGWVDVSAANFWEFGGAIAVVASDSGRYAMRISGGNFGGSIEMRWNGAGAPPAFADGEMYVRFRHRTDVSSELGLAGRAANNYASGSFSAYWVRGRASGTSVLGRYREYNSASFSGENDWTTVASAVGVDCHLMLKMTGSSIQYKLWKEGDTEPAYSTTTDSTLTAGQRLMLFGGNQMNTDIYFVGVGTEGDPAPRGGAPAGATPTLTGGITLDNVDPTGTLGLNPSTLTGSITLDAVAPTGTLGIAPGQVTTLPFVRNSGSRPLGLTAIAVAILSDDANMTRLAGATSLSMDSSGRVTYTGAGLPSVGTSVIVVTRESDGRLGAERYTVA